MADTPEKLPFWFSDEQVSIVKNAAAAWFAKLRAWAMFPVAQLDPRTCSVTALKELAWQRDADRFSGEPLELHRLRVEYAYPNAKDAGSTSGFERIFQRLGIGAIKQHQRMPGVDWDVIDIELTDEQLTKYPGLLDVLVRKYGRTCRRYRWRVVTRIPCYIRVYEFGNSYDYDIARLPACTLAIRAHDVSNTYDYDVAPLPACTVKTFIAENGNDVATLY
jgi:hypothetical protein